MGEVRRDEWRERERNGRGVLGPSSVSPLLFPGRCVERAQVPGRGRVRDDAGGIATKRDRAEVLHALGSEFQGREMRAPFQAIRKNLEVLKSRFPDFRRFDLETDSR